MIKKKKIIYIPEEEETIDNKLKKLRKQLKQCQEEKEEYLTQAQRARADLINYRRRQEESLPELISIGQASIINDILLPVLDSLDAGAKENKILNELKNR